MATPGIAFCKIYPGIGIARLGDSPDSFFIGPESPGLGPQSGTEFKDAQGRVARQAARFRVFGYDADGKVVQELTAVTPGVTLAWTVQLANHKAAGTLFAGVRHGTAQDKDPDQKQLRNLGIADRTRLQITPAPRRIDGINRHGQQYAFDDGAFDGVAVYLGELRTDEQGRLIVLGGHGRSGCIPGSRPITHYANNDGWFDDSSDGQVQVEVMIDGKNILVQGSSWVLVAPPKYAPYVRNVVSLYDVMAAAAAVPAPDILSFTEHIYPHFHAFADQQWVNGMALRGHGPQKGGNFLSSDVIGRLNDNSKENMPYRQTMLARLRDPGCSDASQANYNYMPLLSGDEGDATVGKHDTWLALPPHVFDVFRRWAAGDFESDWPGMLAPSLPIERLAVAEQPAALNRAALEWCVGGPFFPGIEITYICRYADYYSEPFRFDGARLGPGDLTRRMAVPWQADFYECRQHWWPAQRPDDVLSREAYLQGQQDFPAEALAGNLSQVLTGRIAWDRGVGDHWVNPEAEQPPEVRRAAPGDNGMVEQWSALGFVVPVHSGGGEILQVEVGRSEFDGLGDRDYFYYLLNIESYPAFVPKARALAEMFLSRAQALLDDPSPGAVDDMYRYFPYSNQALGQRLDEIYASLQAYAGQDPLADAHNPFQSVDDMVERIRQFAPLNQLDGAWVRNVAKAGPINEVAALLFSVWMDEVGDGNPSQNHANVYTNLLEKVGLHLAPINTRDYAYNPDMLDSAYTVPMFELAISQFTEAFYPEILGMTLQLEWEVLGLWPTVKLLRHFGIDSHFYELHIGIDNAANGHGAKARLAVERFLDEARARGGESEVQAVWGRIWNGYVAFATSGTLGADLSEMLRQRHTTPPTSAQKVAAIMEGKKKYGNLNHGAKKIGPQCINDLFEDTDAFQQALIDGGFIVPGHPEQSGFFRLTAFQGPMYKVFTDEELALWSEWTVWLGRGGGNTPVETDPAKLMAACIDHFRLQQQGEVEHDLVVLTGLDPAHTGQTISQSISAWFKEPTQALMVVLADPQNKLIAPGDPVHSAFITKVLGANNAMVSAFNLVAPNSNGKTWKQIAVDWISEGCPLPHSAVRARALAVRSTSAPHLALTATTAMLDAHPRGKVQGMGVVH